MNKRLLGILMALALVVALISPPALAGGGPPDQDEPVQADEVRGKPVKVNGKDMRLWVFVHPEKGGKGEESAKPLPRVVASHCTDGNQSGTVPKFADANPSGLTFNINDASIPIDKGAAKGAIHASFNAWDSVSLATYFTVNDSGGKSRPEADGNNTIGWVWIVPVNVLAAAWVWVDANTGKVAEADIFYNSDPKTGKIKWGVFTTCNAQDKYEVGDVGTHEVGHVVGLDHLSDPNAYATMYPSAAKGEVRKRTLTTGDQSGYTAAGGY